MARSRSSSGYFLGAATLHILPWDQSLHQTRGDSGRCTSQEFERRFGPRAPFPAFVCSANNIRYWFHRGTIYADTEHVALETLMAHIDGRYDGIAAIVERDSTRGA
ncbi:hypothetical protein [Dermacoccus barathri]|uniref:hypothetical protein n=1 Tax=Dermacoccus barathri TaxID=322601 RepID=UPI00187960AB|nr:hypothetical protein [Dermacoccus barathri]MBE7372871.1 hypothetical protein [Dermacoccus barathri]